MLRPVGGAAVILLLPACAGTGLPRPVPDLLAEAPEGVPVRLVSDGAGCQVLAVPVGPGGLPAAVRVTRDAIQPGGEVLFQGREWGPRGAGYRIDTIYRDAGGPGYRSLLVTADGDVLERSHSLPVEEVPQAVLLVALAGGRRDVLRADIVSGPSREELYRLWTRDRIGREYLVETDLDGDLLGVWRILQAELRHRIR